MDQFLPVKREERPGDPKVIWKRRFSEAVLNPISVIGRYIIFESGGYLYALNAIDGTMADTIDFTMAMAEMGAFYFSFSGMGETDLNGLLLKPTESATLKTNRIYDLTTMEIIYDRGGGTAGVPLLVGDRVYFGFNDDWGCSTLYAFDTRMRETLWESRLSGHKLILEFPLSTDGKRLYIRSLSHLHALNLETGEVIWVTRLTGKEKEEGNRGCIYFSAPIVFNRTVYLVMDEYIIPYLGKTGKTNYNSWRRYIGPVGLNSMEAGPPPVMMRNNIYVAGGLNFTGDQFLGVRGDRGGYSRITAYDLNKKSTIWETDSGEIIVKRMTLGGKFLIASDFDGRILCISSENGRISWGGELEGGVSVRPAIFFGRAYFGTDQGWLYCISL